VRRVDDEERERDFGALDGNETSGLNGSDDDSAIMGDKGPFNVNLAIIHTVERDECLCRNEEVAQQSYKSVTSTSQSQYNQ
jgi:hypothetical protein